MKYTNEQLKFINYNGSDSIILSATAGSGKEQPLFCKVLTPTGWKLMGDLKIGDEVLTPTGEHSKIINIYPQGIKEVFKITFSDGSFTYAGHEHLWKVQTCDDRYQNPDRFKIKTTDEIAKKLYRGSHKYYYIPLVDIEYPEKKLPIDPYLLGCLLGGGGLIRQSVVGFTNSDEYIINKITPLIEEFGLKLINCSTPNNYIISKGLNSGGLSDNKLMNNLRGLGLMDHLSVDKFIPIDYIISSKEQRLRLLNGLLDTDGYVEKNSIFITLSSKQLVDDIVELVNSIGGVVYVTLKRGRYKKDGKYIECHQAYVMSICLPKEMKFNAFTLPRKKDLLVDKGKTYIPYRAVDAIEYFDKVECQCIEISHPNHLYVTDNHIITHNTHSAVARLNKLIEDGVDPSRIIFFSFTNDAIDELRSRISHDVKITTIHSFTSSLLGKMGLFKPIVTFFEFVNWFKEKYRPKQKDSIRTKMEYAKSVDSFYEEGTTISSLFSAYKLQTFDGIRVRKPKFYDEYALFIKESKSRDFSDMLIDVEKLSRNPKYTQYFVGLYDYIFVDEYQDTSVLQMKILLAIKAKQYHLCGDKSQSIYGFAGANCDMIETLLKQNHKTLEMNLTKNFRSHKSIVTNSNKYTNLIAIAHHKEDGFVGDNLINLDEMYKMIRDEQPLAILSRTNNIIKEIEKNCLRDKIKMRYINFINKEDIKKIEDNKIYPSLKKRLDLVSPYYGGTDNLIKFIKDNQISDTFLTTIHKSKGREFERCIIINSVDPSIILNEGYDIEKYSYITEDGDIDIEARNIHYVAVTRPKEKLYFLIYEH